MLRNRLNVAGYRYRRAKIKCKLTQYRTNKPDYDGLNNTGASLLMTAVKWCLSMNKKFVLMKVAIEGNLFGFSFEFPNSTGFWIACLLN